MKYEPSNFINAALAGTGEARNGGGPIWAIFDADAVKREGWTVTPPHVDIAEGYFFSADSLTELAAKIVNKYQRKPMPPAALQETVTRYNSFVDAGKDADFGKPASEIQDSDASFLRGLGHARDSRYALRPADQRQMPGGGPQWEVIPGLYCGGESAGGFSMHGLARCTVQGRIAGKNAAAEQSKG